MARFKSLSQKEILKMVVELTPLEETRSYKELVAKGIAIGRQEGRQKGCQEGRRREARRLVLLLLQLRIGVVPAAQQRRVAALPLEQLESLGVALLDFRDPSELNAWLADH